MTVKDYIDKFKEFSQKPIFPKVLISLGIALMLIILLSDFSGDDGKEQSQSDVNADFLTADTYTRQTEEKLNSILAEIEGVGKTKVLISVSSTEEYIYAEEYRHGSSQTENSIVIIDKGSEKDALIKKVNNPDISGIVIVCEGGDDPKICEKVYKAVSTALNIPTNRIYVAEMK